MYSGCSSESLRVEEFHRGMEIDLRQRGWYLSSEGIAECEKACNKDKPTLHELSKAALNVCGPMVLQVQKLRNISAPKASEECNHCPRLLKIQLTDGHLTCHGLEIATIPDLGLSIPPGTKISLTGTIAVKGGFLMLDANNTKVLGGEVEKLKEKWELNKTLAKHSRTAISGEGPPPFVPFSQAKGKAGDKPKVNGVVQSTEEKSRNIENREPTPTMKSKSLESTRNSKPSFSEPKEGISVRRGSSGNTVRDDRMDRSNFDKPNSRHFAESRADSQGTREKGTRFWKGESSSQDKSRLENRVENDRQKSGKLEENERLEKSVGRGQPLRTQDSNRGRLRGSRGGRREPAGRGRPENQGSDDSDDYRSRQPSDRGTLWDFISMSSKLTTKDSKGPNSQRPVENEQPDDVKLERSPSKNPVKQVSDVRSKQLDGQDTKGEKSTLLSHQKGDTHGEYAVPKEVDRSKQEVSHKDGRQQTRHQQQHRHPQNIPHGRGRGSRRHDHNDSRSYNQSLPPRLQKKQQQQQQRHQQQHYHYHQHHQPSQVEAEVDGERNDVEYPTDGRLQPSVAQEDEAIVQFSAASGHDSDYPDELQQTGVPEQYPNTHAGAFPGQQGKRAKNFRQSSEQFRPQGQVQQYEESYTPPHIQQQRSRQPPEFVQMVMSSQGQQAQFALRQAQPFVVQGGREQTEVVMSHEYHYAQQAQHPVQPYPVYQLRPAQIPQPQMTPQQTMPQQPVASQMPNAQVGWKKGDHCLALWRDGQFYSAKVEDMMQDGVNYMVSFLDFHNSCEVVPISSLRSYPIIAWGESSNPQHQPTAAVAAVPYYTQPTAAVSLVPRPQVVIPVTGQPPFHAGTRPPIPPTAPVHTQVHWQPAQVQYQEVRPATFQPVMHYGAVPQASSGGPGQAVYGVATDAGVHYVRGMKDPPPGQDVYRVGTGEGGRANSSSSSGSYSKPRRTNRATQAYYAPPRQQKAVDKG